MNKRILLIEDNTISREFLHEALIPLGMPVDIAATLASAVASARQQTYAMFLCDVHLPDGGPDKIFRSLSHLQPHTKNIAITAEASRTARQTLIDIGYLEVWEKPITMKALQNNVRRLLDMEGIAATEIVHVGLWDEAVALRAVGNNKATLTALRNMFLAELPQQTKTIRETFHGKHIAELKAECHRLLAGCGFVGAADLNAAVRHLSENPEDHEHFSRVMQQAERYLANS